MKNKLKAIATNIYPLKANTPFKLMHPVTVTPTGTLSVCLLVIVLGDGFWRFVDNVE
jgi:hypothetical protein